MPPPPLKMVIAESVLFGMPIDPLLFALAVKNHTIGVVSIFVVIFKSIKLNFTKKSVRSQIISILSV